jgi:hypothetical protein
MCQLNRARQSLRSTVLPYSAAASTKPHMRRQRINSLARQRSDLDDTDPVFAGERHARRADLQGSREALSPAAGRSSGCESCNDPERVYVERGYQHATGTVAR